MIISILSREEAEGIAPLMTLPHAIISIGEPEPKRESDATNAVFKDNKYLKGVLYLQFYDIDVDSITNAGYLREIQKIKEEHGSGLFTNDHALQIANFVNEMKGKIEVLICHCEAGISRSSGVAAAIEYALTRSDKGIFDDIRYIPNRLVYRKTLNAFMGAKQS